MEVVHPKGASAPPIPEVPFLGIHYTRQFCTRFELTSRANGVDPESFRWTTAQLGFLQALLYLGVLTEVSNSFHSPGDTPCTSDRFICEKGNRKFVRSNLSLEILQEWSTKERSEEHKQHVQKFLDTCAALTAQYLDPDQFRLPASPVRPDTPDIDTIRRIQTSIVVLGSFMKNWFSGLYSRHGSGEKWSLPPALLVREKLERPCPYNWKRLVGTYPEYMTYYLSQLSWRPDTKDYQHCTERECKAYQVSDETEYNMKDTCGESCRTVGPDMSVVKTILRDGGIPVVKLAKEIDKDIAVRPHDKGPFVAISHVWSDGLGNPNGNVIHQCEFKRLVDRIENIEPEATAVWLDTFCVPVGDTEEARSQRRAAILKMRETYQQARRVLVLDSSLECENLGIENSPLGLEEMKSAAETLTNTIRARTRSADSRDGESATSRNEEPRMTKEGAMSIMLALTMAASGMPPVEAVIMRPFLNALPPEMEQIASLFQSDENIAALECLKEAAARICNSGWMRRLWTFQEGRLAGTLTFQFSDGVINFHTIHNILIFAWIRGHLSHDLVLQNIDGPMLPLNHDISKAKLGARFERVTAHPGSTAHDQHHRLILNALSWRSTSRTEDEAICVAHLFGVPIGDIVPVDETEDGKQDRMRRLLLKLDKVPLSLLFAAPDIERLRTPGFSWCPKSFLGSQYRFAETRTVDLVPCTEEGLRVRLTGWKILEAPAFVAEERGGLRFFIQDRKRSLEQTDATVYGVFSIEMADPPFAILVDFEKVEEVGEETRNYGVCVSYTDGGMKYMWRVLVYVRKYPRLSPARAETFQGRQDFCIT